MSFFLSVFFCFVVVLFLLCFSAVVSCCCFVYVCVCVFGVFLVAGWKIGLILFFIGHVGGSHSQFEFLLLLYITQSGKRMMCD